MNWGEPHEEAVDGFTFAELERMAYDDVVTARCTHCHAEHEVEPDAENYTCHKCKAPRAVTSPLRKLGLI